MKKSNLILPFLDALCVHDILPRYGEVIHNAFTATDAHKLIIDNNIHVSRKTVERHLAELVKADILKQSLAGSAWVYWRASYDILAKS